MSFPDRRTLHVLLTALLFAVTLAIIYIARTVIVIFAFSILFAYLINPIVRFLQRHSLFFKNLRGPHVLEAYLAIIIVTVLLFHGLVPEFRKNAGRILSAIPALANTGSSREIANNLGNNFGWADERADQIRALLERHRSKIEGALGDVEQAAPAVFAGILVIPILAIFFLSDGEKLAHQIIRLVAEKENHGALESLAGELHVMLQRYIRAKVILGGLSLLYCSLTMLLLGFPNAIALGILAGILEFIPVVGWMTAAATIVTAGVLGTMATAGSADGAEIQQEVQTLKEGLKNIDDALKDLKASVDQGLRGNSMNFGHVGRVKDQIEKYTKTAGKFPEYCEIGLSVFYDVYDWHVRQQQQIQISRIAEQRLAIQFMFTQLILRWEAESNYVGTPGDR